MSAFEDFMDLGTRSHDAVVYVHMFDPQLSMKLANPQVHAGQAHQDVLGKVPQPSHRD